MWLIEPSDLLEQCVSINSLTDKAKKNVCVSSDISKILESEGPIFFFFFFKFIELILFFNIQITVQIGNRYGLWGSRILCFTDHKTASPSKI